MITVPPKVTASRLREIARLCGKSRSGTKAAIITRVSDGLKDFKPLAAGTRVLSIDLGIRNLAYSLLEVPAASPPRRGRREKDDAPSRASAPPILHAWERLALIPKTPKASKPEKARKGRQVPGGDEEPGSTVHAAATTLAGSPGCPGPAPADPATTQVPIEDFSPLRLSQLAADLILRRLLPLAPDVVTLEQQRFRSMGGSAVFEWTLRVNSLESMLYAVFTTLQRVGEWPGGRIEGVAARSVLEFMAASSSCEGADAARVWAKKTRKDDNKRLKKDIVGTMLRSGEGVRIDEAGQVGPVVREYVERWGGTAKRGKAGDDGLKKLDDLADCLLQGLAFIRWQENKQKLLEGGLEALEDQMIDE